MEGMKNKAAQELSRKRWEQRSAELQSVSKAGWSEENREKRMANPHGRPFNPNRCPCGKMTKDRAEKRNHKCQSI